MYIFNLFLYYLRYAAYLLPQMMVLGVCVKTRTVLYPLAWLDGAITVCIGRHVAMAVHVTAVHLY